MKGRKDGKEGGRGTISGWFFDVYPVRGGVHVWIIAEDGEPVLLFDTFRPTFYLYVEHHDVDLEGLSKRLELPVTLRETCQIELFSGQEWHVTAVTVHDPMQWNQCVRALSRHLPHDVFFNSNIPIPQLYLYHHDLFPLAYCTCRPADDGSLHWTVLEDREAIQTDPGPDLRILRLCHVYDGRPSKYDVSLTLQISYDDRTYTIEGNNPVGVLETFNEHLCRFDPDVIVSSWGDALIFPRLTRDAKRHNMSLHLNRDASHPYMKTQERIFWTYGEVIHRDAAFMLAGRWHIDTKNSFMMEEGGLNGILEIARLTQMPVQKTGRAAIGTGLASMQMSYAYRNGILIPAEKKEGEAFKTAEDLLLSDRGGLVFLPEPGYHEQVAELDFSSMYPSLMVKHNISPETIDCPCCDNRVVPELGYTICERRQGLVPAVLKPVLARRAYYKEQKRKATSPEAHRRYHQMQNALKWMLVTCFGYLGYKNARFGRIEAHEAVNAFSREALLTAKEVAEAHGMHLVHAIIDCLWLKKPDATREEYEAICCHITEAVGVEMSLEGVYNWILFPPSKTDPGIPTVGKYVGWYDHGELKVRGLEMRRRDTPGYVKHVQARLLDLLEDAGSINQIRIRIPALIEEVRFYLHELRQGRVDPRDLLIRRRVQKKNNEYRNNNLNALVVRDLASRGIQVQPGEIIEFIILDQTGKRDPRKARSLLTYQPEDGYDTEKYTEQVLKAVETLLAPFGYDMGHLEHLFGVKKRRRRKKPEKAQLELLF
jgi:DNA polymerase-2